MIDIAKKILRESLSDLDKFNDGTIKEMIGSMPKAEKKLIQNTLKEFNKSMKKAMNFDNELSHTQGISELTNISAKFNKMAENAKRADNK